MKTDTFSNFKKKRMKSEKFLYNTETENDTIKLPIVFKINKTASFCKKYKCSLYFNNL